MTDRKKKTVRELVEHHDQIVAQQKALPATNENGAVHDALHDQMNLLIDRMAGTRCESVEDVSALFRLIRFYTIGAAGEPGCLINMLAPIMDNFGKDIERLFKAAAGPVHPDVMHAVRDMDDCLTRLDEAMTVFQHVFNRGARIGVEFDRDLHAALYCALGIGRPAFEELQNTWKRAFRAMGGTP